MFKRVVSRTAGISRMAGGCQRRNLNVHEYSAKQLLNEFGATTEFGVMATTVEEVRAACNQIGSTKKVVKSQILSGGRGKGTFKDGFQGGVHVCANTEDAIACAGKMLGNTLVTKQTGEKGIVVNKLFVTEAIPNIKREIYLALLLDRNTCSPTFIGSAQGGMNIEEVAEKTPDAIKKLIVNVHTGIDGAAARRFAEELGFMGESVGAAVKQINSIYNLAKTKDATMVEINPLVELDDGQVMCIDAKLSFDDSAEFRQGDVWKHQDKSAMDWKEVEAHKYDLNYIALDGNVGCLVNGAGLAMATMDIIQLYGQKPANFLDVGGSATTEQVVNSLKIITSDPNVKCVLVNIFGGIMLCDTIAQGIVDGVKQLGGMKVPLVVRLEGSHVEEGKAILANSGLAIHTAKDLNEGAKIASELVAKA